MNPKWGNMFMQIPLSNGMFALIDDEDHPLISKYKWHAVKGWNTHYARSWAPGNIKGKGHKIYMHRLILGITAGEYVDHKNGNGLDNRRSINLRKCTTRENSRNSAPRKNAKSQIKGVSWCKQTGKWAASIRVNGKPKWLGRFNCEKQAGNAYDIAALKYFGKFARTNNK